MRLAATANPSSEHLSVLLEGIAAVDHNQDPMIEQLALDSRDVRPGSLFFAVPGLNEDGRQFIPSAIAAGACAVVFEADNWQIADTAPVPQIGVRDLKQKISEIAAVFFRHPSHKMHIVGITGTNGKSSCAALSAQALESLGHRCGIVGTLGSGFTGELTPASLTTPNSISLQRHLASLADSGAQYLCLEVSSHSLDQSRTTGVRFGTVVFTNLSQDHLDYHKSEANYRSAKSRLFTETAAAHAVLNIDDEFGRSLLGKTTAEHEITYGRRSADVQLVELTADREGIAASISIAGHSIRVRNTLLGRFNGINITTVAAILYSLGIEPAEIEIALNSLVPIAGRLERITGCSNHAAVYVDYAHTPDGLEQALSSLREFTQGAIWCVFGCGGDRDTEKRSMMGALAERFADRVIVTDDNPRSESPAAIVKQIRSGMKSAPMVEHDRAQAIDLAIRKAQPEDAVLIAGKGHETRQIYRDRSVQFSDREVAAQVLRSLQC